MKVIFLIYITFIDIAYIKSAYIEKHNKWTKELLPLNGFGILSRIKSENVVYGIWKGAAMRSEQEVNYAIERYSDMVLRLCMVNLKNSADAEDIFQTVFLKYTLHDKAFESPEHEKAWLIRVTVNACRDLLKSFFRSRVVSLVDLCDYAPSATSEQYAVMEAVWSLPRQYRDVIYLHYYEGYTAPEIAGILKRNPNTVYTHLHKGKELLREALGGVVNGQSN